MTTSLIKKFWFFPLLALLISCQRGTEIKKTAYQTAASQQIASMVKKTNYLATRGAKSGRGATGMRLIGEFDLFGMQPFGGQFLPNNVDQVSAGFFQMMQQINGAMTNEQAYITGVRAVNTIFQYGNPGAAANQYLDQYSQQGLAYLQAYTVPGASFNQFTANPSQLSPFYSFMNNGYFQGLLY